MNLRTKHRGGLLVAPALAGCLLAGCDDGSRADDDGQARSAQAQEQRARQVADAWRGSAAVAVWRRGYFPTADVVQPPASGWHGRADRQAYETGNFALRGGLPAATAERGKVEWRGGDTLTRPLWGAKKAYGSFARNDSAGPRLTVTGARLGTTTVATSRGPATVPAWLFTLDGYDAPLKRVAVTASRLPESPVAPVREGAVDGLRALPGLAGTAADGRSVTVRAAHGACDDGPVVEALETDESVVLHASVKGARDGACTADLIEQDVRVGLRRPLGSRILLDAFTGRPVPSTAR
ncbi:hypothetical protein AB0D74_42730 [Streptomyces sp. NPDC048278]|uniref:hypothetical protein n=1 Tax=Streptomyces sp. NPDC048278 TaxID=3155809 RepID=UPI0034255DCA